MNLSSNIKDKISTIFGILAAIAGGLLTVGQNGVVLPPWATAVASSTVAISIAVIGYLTGKTPAANGCGFPAFTTSTAVTMLASLSLPFWLDLCCRSDSNRSRS